MNHFTTFLMCFLFCITLVAQNIPSDRVLPTEELARYLTISAKNNIQTQGEISEEKLASYFREKFTERYFLQLANR